MYFLLLCVWRLNRTIAKQRLRCRQQQLTVLIDPSLCCFLLGDTDNHRQGVTSRNPNPVPVPHCLRSNLATGPAGFCPHQRRSLTALPLLVQLRRTWKRSTQNTSGTPPERLQRPSDRQNLGSTTCTLSYLTASTHVCTHLYAPLSNLTRAVYA